MRDLEVGVVGEEMDLVSRWVDLVKVRVVGVVVGVVPHTHTG